MRWEIGLRREIEDGRWEIGKRQCGVLNDEVD